MKENQLLKKLRQGGSLPFSEQLLLTIQLSIPAILAQISVIMMQYIDASMVGQLGAKGSAAIGLISSTTWLIDGLCAALAVGFTVQVAHAVGAGEEKKARGLASQGLVIILLVSMLLGGFGVIISGPLPHWLGGGSDIRAEATRYFAIYMGCLPFYALINISSGLLQCSGNMVVPSIVQVLMCILDVVFNAFFIFAPGTLHLGQFTLPGMGLGVAGAAIGTATAEAIALIILLYFLLFRSASMRLRKEEKLSFHPAELQKALRIAIPVALENVALCGAQILSTKIVSPLGTVAIAANSLSVTAESLCYMPGYGIASASTTLIGQSIGARRKDLVKHFGRLVIILGMLLMTGTGIFMFYASPIMLRFLTPDLQVQQLGTAILRIEAFAEPFYGASIVATGVFRGAGDTFVPSILNFVTMWLIRLPLAWFLAPRLGLRGVWIAMALELTARGIVFLVRFARGKWQDKALHI